MMLEVEAIARRKIPLSALKAVYTVRQLAATIIRTASTSEELVTCAKQGDGAPFFFCHGDYTTRGLYAFKLAEMLKCDQPVFLLNPYRDPDPKFSIEEMARCYLPHLLAAQPAGAFRLGGFCNGGLLAWELAHQLESLGRRVEFIVLIDVRSLNARLTFRIIASLTRLIAAAAPKKIGEKLKLDVMRAIWNRLGQAFYYGPYLRAMSNYLPPKLRSNVVIVLSEEHRVMKKLPPVSVLSFSPTPWNRLAPKVHCRYVPGTHHGAITTHAGELALLLDGLLSTEPLHASSHAPFSTARTTQTGGRSGCATS